MIATSGFLTAF